MKTYVGVYPQNGRVTIMRDYGGTKKEVFEKDITKFVYDDVTVYEFLSIVKKSFDDPPDYICITNDTWVQNNAFINKAKEIRFKNFEVVEQYKAKSLEAIFDSGNNLENNKIIWTCLQHKFCIWQGKFCLNNKYQALEDLMILSENKYEETLEITEFPPDVMIYENFERNKIDCDFISQLFPECKIFEFVPKTPTNGALIYAQFMEVKQYSDKVLNAERRKNSVSKNNKNFPITYIHVAIDTATRYISASYYHNRTRKTFNVKGTLLSDDETGWKEIEKKLKIAKSRLNGEFARIRFVDEEKEFCVEWAKEMGFKQIEVIKKGEMRYDEIIYHLPFEIQNSDILWIQQKSNMGYSDYNNDDDIYEIWESNEYQGDIRPIDLKEMPFALNHIPSYVISTKNLRHYDYSPRVNEIKNSRLKDYFPKNCRFFFFESHEFSSNMLPTYSQTMAEEYYSLLGGTIDSNIESINEMEHLKLHPNNVTKEPSSTNNIKELESDTTELLH